MQEAYKMWKPSFGIATRNVVLAQGTEFYSPHKAKINGR